jgi:hypothetical protein
MPYDEHVKQVTERAEHELVTAALWLDLHLLDRWWVRMFLPSACVENFKRKCREYRCIAGIETF